MPLNLFLAASLRPGNTESLTAKDIGAVTVVETMDICAATGTKDRIITHTGSGFYIDWRQPRLWSLD